MLARRLLCHRVDQVVDEPVLLAHIVGCIYTERLDVQKVILVVLRLLLRVEKQNRA